MGPGAQFLLRDTSSEPVAASNQPRVDQRVVILLSNLIENKLDNRGYNSWTTSWRGESRSTECHHVSSSNGSHREISHDTWGGELAAYPIEKWPHLLVRGLTAYPTHAHRPWDKLLPPTENCDVCLKRDWVDGEGGIIRVGGGYML